MPIYEYICQSCDHELEALQIISDNALTDCPACKASKLIKKISAAAFHLKGNGWYVTDFKDKNPKKKTEEKATEKTAEKATEKATEKA